MSSDAFDAVVERMAEAVLTDEHWGWNLDADDALLVVRVMRRALAAAMEPPTKDCPNCRDGFVPWGSGSPWVEEGSDPCPDCDDGRVPDPDAARLILGRRVEFGSAHFRYGGWGTSLGPPGGSCVPVYVEVTDED